MSRWAISDGPSFREISRGIHRERGSVPLSLLVTAGANTLSRVALVALRKLPDRLHQDSCVSSELNVRLMKQSVERRDRMSEASNAADVERLAKSVEEDGLPYSMAMGELLRSLSTICLQTLSRHRRAGS